MLPPTEAMSNIVRSIRNNCVVLDLHLHYKQSNKLRNEIKHINLITNELSKICNILYNRPTFSSLPRDISKSKPKLELVLASSNVNILSRILASVNGIQIRDQISDEGANLHSEFDSNIIPPDKVDFRLNELYNSLKSGWASKKGITQNALISPWVFSSISPSILDTINDYEAPIITLTDNLVQDQHKNGLTETGFLEGDDFNISTTFISGNSDMQETTLVNILNLSSTFHRSLGTTSPTLRAWFHGINNIDVQDPESLQKEKEKLDLLLHGFSGL